MQKLLDFLADLVRLHIHYYLERNREGAIMVLIAVPGQRWEVEFFADGQVEVETFLAQSMEGEEALARLLKEYGD